MSENGGLIMSDKIQVDPEKFAYKVLGNLPVADYENKDPESVSKEKLLQFLSAYFVATRFNNYELQRFDEMDDKHAYPSYQKVVETINNATWGIRK